MLAKKYEMHKIRIFVVGAPRSGTTLVQAMLASHPEVTSFPESHFYPRLFGGGDDVIYGPKIRDSYLGKLYAIAGAQKPNIRLWTNKAPAGIRSWLTVFLKATNNTHFQADIDALPNEVRALSSKFINILDLTTPKSAWVEKTPGNLFYIDQISKLVDGAKFIHIIRDGESVVASIRDASKKYSEWSRHSTENQPINHITYLWNRSIDKSIKYTSRVNHFIFLYDDLICDPELVMRNVSRFVGIDFDRSMLTPCLDNIVRPREQWKNDIGESITRRPSKFSDVLSPTEQEIVRKNLNYLPKDAIRSGYC